MWELQLGQKPVQYFWRNGASQEPARVVHDGTFMLRVLKLILVQARSDDLEMRREFVGRHCAHCVLSSRTGIVDIVMWTA